MWYVGMFFAAIKFQASLPCEVFIRPYGKPALPAISRKTLHFPSHSPPNPAKHVQNHAKCAKFRKTPPKHFARIPKLPTFALAFRKGDSHNDEKRDHRQTANRQKNKTMSISAEIQRPADKLKSRFHPYR